MAEQTNLMLALLLQHLHQIGVTHRGDRIEPLGGLAEHGTAQKHAALERIDSRVTRWAKGLSGKSSWGQRASSWRSLRMAKCAGMMGMSRSRQAFWASSS